MRQEIEKKERREMREEGEGEMEIYYRAMANEKEDIFSANSAHHFERGIILDEEAWNALLSGEDTEIVDGFCDLCFNPRIVDLEYLQQHQIFTRDFSASGQMTEFCWVLDGVCCCSSLTELQNYLGNLEGLSIIAFEGEHISTCPEGEIVRPTRLIEKTLQWERNRDERNTKQQGETS